MADLYPPPVDQLLTLGEPNHREPWTDYPALGLTGEHVPVLLELIRDPRLAWDAHVEGEDETRFWAPVHAWRALGQLGAEPAVEPLVRLLVDEPGDDWVINEVPTVLGMIGPAALRPVRDALPAAARAPGPWLAAQLGSALAEIGITYPEAREEAVAALMRQLGVWPVQDPALNGFLISNLIDLHAVEAAALIQEALEGEGVEESIRGDWEDVQVALGLIAERTTPRPHYHLGWGLNPRRVRIVPPAPGSSSPAARAQRLRKAQKQAARKKKRRR